MMKKPNKKIVEILLLFTAAVFVTVCVYGIGRMSHRSAPMVEDTEAGDGENTSVQEEEKQEEQEEPISYPAPAYPFKTDEITVVVDGLEREYDIAFVNDIHLITDHKSGDVTEENLKTVTERYESMAVTEDGVHAEELWQEMIKYLNYNDFDAVIFGGDILDYCSNSNIIALNAGFRELKYPADRIMYLRSDHDYGGWYGGSGFTDSDGFVLQSYVLDGDSMEKCIELDDLVIVGVNQSYREISEGTLELMEEKLQGDKPVLLATHVPFYSEVEESLADLSMEVRGRIYYWSDDSTVYVPSGRTRQFIDMVYAKEANVVQIVGAHLHAAWDGYVTEDLKEHIFAPGFQGNIGIIHVIGGENENDEENGDEGKNAQIS